MAEASAMLLLGACATETSQDALGSNAQEELSEAHAEETQEQKTTGNVLVACFSATGNTRAIAQELASSLGADYLEIEPKEPYTSEDLDYGDSSTRATAEQNDGTIRPAIATALPDWSNYGTVLLGHPIWWGKAPRIMLTLVESAAEGLAGKQVANFCTSGSSGIDSAADELMEALPDATWGEGCRFEVDAAADEIVAWAHELGFGIA